MALLHNRVNRKALKERLMAETFKRITLSFYRYVIIETPETFRDELWKAWNSFGCFGRIYVAKEGINAQLSVPEYHFEAFKESLEQIPALQAMPLKIAVEDNGKSFYKLTIKVREKIVADGLDDNSFDVTNVGTHLTAKAFNEAMKLPNTIVVDMRNRYESEVGHFEGAILPQSDTFREELPEVLETLKADKDKKILLYCTGGVRCEKASAYLKHHGFEDVNQLHGGIIDYVRQIKQEGLPSAFKGKNFVFDDRLGERITDDVLSKCHCCGLPADNHYNCENPACHVLFIQCDSCKTQLEGCCSTQCLEEKDLPISELKDKVRNLGFRPHHFHHKSKMRALKYQP